MPVNTSDAFFAVLEKSKLLSSGQLSELRDEFAGQDDPKTVALKMVKFGVLNKWQAIHLLAGRYALTLGKYKFLAQLDSDRTERVYLAKDPSTGKRVAVKTLSRNYIAENPQALQQFVNQAKQASSLQHPNIAHIFDIDNEDDRYFLVLEYVRGESLDETIRTGGPLPAERAAKYLSQVASALGYAHKNELFHGQLNGRSVLLDHHDRIKVVNLGIKGPAGSAETGPFSAPELVKDSSPTSAADVYSLGCLGYLLLTGKQPGDDAAAKLIELRPDIPAGLLEICRQMLAPKPDQRPEDATELSKQLAAWAVDLGDDPSSGGADSDDEEPDSVRDVDFDTIADAEIEEVEAEPASVRFKPVAVRKDLTGADAGEVEEIVEAEPDEDELRLAPPEEIKLAGGAKQSAGPLETAPTIVEPSAKPPQAKPPAKRPAQAGSSPSPAAAPSPPPPKDADQTKPKAKAVPPRKPQPTMDAAGPAPKIPAIGGPAAVAAESIIGSGELTLQVGKKPKGKAKAGAAGLAAAAGGGGKMPPKALIIGGAAVAGLLLVGGLIFGATWLLSGGDQREVAAGDADASPAESGVEPTDPEANPAAAEVDPEQNPEFNPEVDPEIPSTTPATDSTAETPADDASAPGATETAASPSDQVNVGPADGGGVTEPPADSDTPGEPAAPMPDEPPTETPPGNPPAKPAEAKPAEPPKPTPPPKPKETKKPFQDLGGKLQLPDLATEDGMKPKQLGSVHIPDGELCFVKLRGGEKACKGSVKFELRNADGGLAEKDWEVFLAEGESGPRTPIAHLGVDDQAKLTFQWLPAAKDQPLAPHLQNCALSLSCASESHVVLFREPLQVEAMAVDLQKPSTREDWELVLPPDEKAIRLEVLPVAGTKAVVDQKPEETMADGGGARIKMDQAGGILSFQVTSKIGRRFELTVTPFVKFSENKPEVTPNRRKLQTDRESLQVWVAQYEPVVKKMEEEIRKKKNPDEKRRDEQKLFPFQNEVKIRKERIEKIMQLEKLLDELDEKLRLNFRVYYDTGLTDVELLKIGK